MSPQSTSVQRVAHVLFHIGTCCLVTGLSVLGLLSMRMPSIAAELYGLPVSSTEAAAWVKVAGLRDFGLAIAAAAIYGFDARSLRVFVPTLLLIPIGDAVLTFTDGGTVPGALTHLGGVVCIGVLAACAWLDPALDAPVKRA